MYAETFGISPSEAKRHVGDVLSRWDALGYIICDDVASLNVSTIDLTTALGRLLSNAALRQAFKDSPETTANKLRVCSEDREFFIALDGGDLERQVEMLRNKQAELRHRAAFVSTGHVFASIFDPNDSMLAAAIEMRMNSDGASARRYYRMLTTTFCLGYASSLQETWVHPVLAHLECAIPAQTDIVIDLLEGEGGHLVLFDIVPVAHCIQVEQLAPLIKSRILRTAIDRHNYFFHFHAAVVAHNDTCFMLPGAPGRGKTTLTAGLILSGFRYLTDEVALFEEGSFTTPPLPLSLGIKSGAVEVLAALWPAVRELATHLREDGEQVRYLIPPAASVLPDGHYLVNRIVFPHYAPGQTTRLLPLTKPEALRWLMKECLTVPKPLDRFGVEIFVNWLRKTECYSLLIGSLAEAVTLLHRLCGD